MASARMFEFMVIWQSIFIPISIAFGASTGSLQLSNAVTGPQSVLLAPFLDFQSLLKSLGFLGFANCGLLDFGCNASNVSQATVFAGAIIGYGGLLVFQVLQKIGAGIFLIFALGSFFGNSYGIPFLGQIELGFLILMVIYGLALIKPGGHGTS